MRTQVELRDDIESIVATFAADGRHVAFVEPGGLRFPSDESATVFAEWVDDADSLGAWLQVQRQRFDGDDAPRQLEPFTILRGEHRVVIRYVAGSSRPDALLLAERAARANPEHFTDIGLTTREAQVLGLLVDGAGSDEIATTLGISSGTVRKHLERVYRKLGVQSRAQAVAAAFERLTDA